MENELQIMTTFVNYCVSQMNVMGRLFCEGKIFRRHSEPLMMVNDLVIDLFQGAFTFRGSMIDMPLLLQAKNIVQLSESIHQG